MELKNCTFQTKGEETMEKVIEKAITWLLYGNNIPMANPDWCSSMPTAEEFRKDWEKRQEDFFERMC